MHDIDSLCWADRLTPSDTVSGSCNLVWSANTVDQDVACSSKRRLAGCNTTPAYHLHPRTLVSSSPSTQLPLMENGKSLGFAAAESQNDRIFGSGEPLPSSGGSPPGWPLDCFITCIPLHGSRLGRPIYLIASLAFVRRIARRWLIRFLSCPFFHSLPPLGMKTFAAST